MTEGTLGAYVYCVLGGDVSPSRLDVDGVDPQHTVRAVPHRGMTALVSDVSLTEFGAEPLKRNLNDLRWVERTARAHQRVLDRALGMGAIVPLRLCTVCRDDAGVRAMLDREHEPLAGALTRLAGRQEWGIKLLANPQRAGERMPEGAAADAPGSGRAYVDRLRRDRAARDDAQRKARAAALAIHRALAAQSIAARVLPKPPSELAGEGGALILNGAYLVDADRAEAFRALAGELRERRCAPDMRLEITGPWPPYSFVAEPTDERRRPRAGVRR